MNEAPTSQADAPRSRKDLQCTADARPFNGASPPT